MTSRWRRDDLWTVLARRQDQVIGWSQLREWGWTIDDLRRPVDSGHWVRLEPGVVAATTAPLSARGLVWQAVLATGGIACGGTALWLAGLDGGPWGPLREGGTAPAAPATPGRRGPGAPVEIAIDWTRKLRRTSPSRVVHRHRDLQGLTRRNADVPRVRAEVAALEVCGRLERDEDAAALVLAVVQQRLCTVPALRAHVEASPAATRRALVLDMLAEASEGVATMLELRYARDVERRHGLPTATRNTDVGDAQTPQIVDVLYDEFGVVVELDGQVAHPRHLAFRDHARDNRTVIRGRVPLRFGWRDVGGRPCNVAVQVASVLTSRGWAATTRRCGATCAVR